MEWLLNNTVGIIKINKQLPYQWLLLIVHTFQSLPQSYVPIRNDSCQMNQCEYEFVNAHYDVGHTYGINWKWNNWSHFHFYFNHHLIFNWKKNQLESLKYQLSAWPMKCISFNGLRYHIIKMAMNYIEIIICASKLHVFNLVLIFCPDSTDVAKYDTDTI